MAGRGLLGVDDGEAAGGGAVLLPVAVWQEVQGYSPCGDDLLRRHALAGVGVPHIAVRVDSAGPENRHSAQPGANCRQSPRPVVREERNLRLGRRVRGHLRRGVVAVQKVRKLAAADIAGRMDIPLVDVFAEPRPPCRMEPRACVGHADRGRGERLAHGKKAPLRVQRNRSRMAGLLVGMALRRRDPSL